MLHEMAPISFMPCEPVMYLSLCETDRTSLNILKVYPYPLYVPRGEPLTFHLYSRGSWLLFSRCALYLNPRGTCSFPRCSFHICLWGSDSLLKVSLSSRYWFPPQRPFFPRYLDFPLKMPPPLRSCLPPQDVLNFTVLIPSWSRLWPDRPLSLFQVSQSLPIFITSHGLLKSVNQSL